MSSFIAKLTVAGKEYNLLNVNYELFQNIDETGRPSSITRGGKINFIIESSGSTEFFEWMTNSFEHKNGSVKFLKRDSNATLKELKFTEGYLISHYESFNSAGSSPVMEYFTVSAKVIELGNGVHDNEWPSN